MAGKHRKRGSRSKKIAMVGVATATATAMTIGAAPPPPKPKPVVNGDVDLAAAIRPFPPPNQIPDLTFGGGTAVYDFGQLCADVLLRAIVENVNIAALAQAAGVDPNSLLEGLLGSTLDQLPANLLDNIFGAVPILPGDLAEAIVGGLGLDVITAGLLEPLLATALSALGIDSVGDLLGLVGLDLSDPLNLSNLDLPGVNVITAGPPFTLLKLLGADLGWVPSLPNSVANEINNSEYLEVGVVSLLEDVLERTNIPALDNLLQPILSLLPDVDVLDLRVPVTVGFGLGAFAAGMAYDKVLADLPNQPGGAQSSEHPLLGSVTVLPMILLRNPGRANGGLFARFYPLFGLAGIETVTPETEVSSSGGIPILNTGLSLGGANLIPVKVDGTIQFDILSDFAAWPNPFSIANSLVGAALPTYILRGITLDTIPEQLTTQLAEILDNPLGDPLAINLYLTIPSATLPLLEPLYLVSDAISLMTFGAGAVNPVGMFANALAPALLSLANLGYTDVVRNPDGTYTRTLTEAGVPTSFFSFPAVDPVQAITDVVNLLVRGFTKEFFSGNPTAATPNAITNLLSLLTGGLGPLGNLGGLVQGVLDGLNPLATQQVSPLAATDVPAADARMIPVSTEAETDESLSGTAESETADAPAEEEVPEEEVAEEGVPEEEVPEEEVAEEEVAEEEAPEEEAPEEEVTEEDAVDEDVTEDDVTEDDVTKEDVTDEPEEASNTPKHAKPDTEENEPAEPAKQTTPKHAKPDNARLGDDARDESASDSDEGASDKAA